MTLTKTTSKQTSKQMAYGHLRHRDTTAPYRSSREHQFPCASTSWIQQRDREVPLSCLSLINTNNSEKPLLPCNTSLLQLGKGSSNNWATAIFMIYSNYKSKNQCALCSSFQQQERRFPGSVSVSGVSAGHTAPVQHSNYTEKKVNNTY